MVNLQPYKDILTRIGFKENQGVKNFWTIKTVDMKTGKPAEAGIHLGYYDPEDKIGEPHLKTQEGEVMDSEAYERCSNLKDFYMERQTYLDRESSKVVEEEDEVEEVEEEEEEVTPQNVFREPIGNIRLPQTNIEPPRQITTPKTIEDTPSIKDVLRRVREEVNTTKNPPHLIRTPGQMQPLIKTPEKPQVDYLTICKNKKAEELHKIQNELNDYAQQYEALSREIEEKMREDQERIDQLQNTMKFLAVKEKIVSETYDKLIQNLP